MATTTPNFGWTVPTSTDLVKDGATAIETLGDGIDASFVDLKGGTTGQVLSKASGTDLDFTWVAQDDSNAIQNAIVDAKGDLIAATAADTPARLAVGTNGQVLTADSTAATGLKWASAGASATSWTLINTGGTNLTGATSVTVSGISTYNDLYIYIERASSVNGSSTITCRPNNNSGAIYYYNGFRYVTNAANLSISPTTGSGSTSIILAALNSDEYYSCYSSIWLSGISGAGKKTFQSHTVGDAGATVTSYNIDGYMDTTSAITSITILSSTGNLDGDKIYIYGA